MTLSDVSQRSTGRLPAGNRHHFRVSKERPRNYGLICPPPKRGVFLLPPAGPKISLYSYIYNVLALRLFVRRGRYFIGIDTMA